MTNINLPAYLQNSRAPRLAERSTEGMGSAMPPHISIRGNRFHLIDQSGDERDIDLLHLDVCIADISDKMCKLYFGDKKWEPGSTDPPICFSANGVAPSKEAAEPQSPTCQECQWNVRGSAVSAMSGKPIKACRDEKWLAVLIPGQNIVFQFRVTPGSFKNWKAYGEKFKGQPFDIKDVLTRLQFDKDANGVITFEPTAFIDETLAKFREEAFAAQITDLIVGRKDQPVALPAPEKRSATDDMIAAVNAPPGAVIASPYPNPAVPKTRGRPKKQEAAPASNGQAQAPFANPAPATPAQAPFAQQAQAAEPPSEMKQALESFFGKS